MFNLQLIYIIYALMQIETLEMEIKHINTELDEIKSDIKDIKWMFDKLDDRYTTRREFNAVKRILWVLVSLVTLVNIFLSIK